MWEDLKKNEEENDEDNHYGIGSFLWEVVKVFVLALVIIMPVRILLFQPFFVQGASMEPNFEDGEYLVINEFGYKQTDIGLEDFKLFTIYPQKDLERQDVVVFRYPKNPKQFFIKRIIGLPGERIVIREGKVFIHNTENPEGLRLDEANYLSPDIQTIPPVDRRLTMDEYFVMGDNRAHSNDSRHWGAVQKDKIIGKVLLRAWPLGRMNVF